MTTRHFADVSRRLTTEVWYPAAAGVEEEATTEDWIFRTRAARDARLRSGNDRLPLALLSHGNGGDRWNLAWLGEALAAHGWLAAAVDHPGDRTGDQSAEGTFAVWRRPPDLGFVLTALLADPAFGPRIDPDRIVAAGHSSGGYTVLMLAGARFRPAAMLAYCAGPHPGADCGRVAGVEPERIRDVGRAELDHRDSRIRAVLSMAPVFGPGTPAESLRAIRIPVLIAASPSDEMVPFEDNAERFGRTIPDARLLTLPDAGHFVFLSVCNRLGRIVARQVCADPARVDRDAAHRRVVEAALRFESTFAGTGALVAPPGSR